MRTIEKASGRQVGSSASGMRERKGDPDRRPPAFKIVCTDRESGTGYLTHDLLLYHKFNVNSNSENCPFVTVVRVAALLL